MTWPAAFVWTCAVEQPVYFLFLRRRFARWWELSALTLAVNAMTHPLLWFGLLALPRFGRAEVAFGEACVVLAEAGLAAWLLKRRDCARPAWLPALTASSSANLAAFCVGRLLR